MAKAPYADTAQPAAYPNATTHAGSDHGRLNRPAKHYQRPGYLIGFWPQFGFHPLNSFGNPPTGY
jgi:hypothetical protein